MADNSSNAGGVALNQKNIDINIYVGKWKGVIASRFAIVEIDQTMHSDTLVGWITFIGNDGTALGEKSMFTSITPKEDGFLTLQLLSEQMTILGWVASRSMSCPSSSQFIGLCIQGTTMPNVFLNRC